MINPAHTLGNDRGVATSLIEAVVIIAVSAILTTITIVPAVGGLEDARIAKAFSDTESIGIAVHNFVQDTGAPPAFKSGQGTSATDAIFRVLETMGEDPTDDTNTWPTGADDIDLLANHLMLNRPNGTGPAYPRIGERAFNRLKGWNGPYLSQAAGSDPWGDKYFVNVQFLTPQGVAQIRDDPDNPVAVPTGTRVAVVVLSPGPDRTIETDFAQPYDAFVTGGDDIIFRIQ